MRPDSDQRTSHLVFTIGLGGFSTAFRKNVDSQREYCRRLGYDYLCFEGEEDPTLKREVAWLKIPLMIGALAGKYESVLFLDADIEVKGDCPDFTTLVDDIKPLAASCGHSGRYNTGMIMARRSGRSHATLTEAFSLLGTPLQKRHQVGWGENGYLIKAFDDSDTVRALDKRWNNTDDPELDDHMRHYTGPMRNTYVFDEMESAAWQEILERPTAPGESQIGDRYSSFFAIRGLYESLTDDLPTFAPFSFEWCGMASGKAVAPAGAPTLHLAVDVDFDNPNNPYVADLARSIAGRGEFADVITGQAEFWTREYAPGDIVHIQWIEALFDWKTPDSEDLDRLEDRLREISRTARVVYTVHNLRLKADYGEIADTLLALVGPHLDACIHLSEASIPAFAEAHPRHDWIARCAHHVSGHGHYLSYLDIEQLPFEDRCLAADRPVVLVFGGLRSSAELELCLEVGRRIDEAGLQLMICGPAATDVVHWKEIVELRDNWETGEPRRLHSHVPTNTIVSLFESVNYVFVPRHDRLNSGVQFLAYTFGKLPICPDEMSIGHCQREVGGPTYRPGDAADAADKILAAHAMTAGERLQSLWNLYTYRESRMGMSPLSSAHIDAYRAVATGGVDRLSHRTSADHV